MLEKESWNDWGRFDSHILALEKEGICPLGILIDEPQYILPSYFEAVYGYAVSDAIDISQI